MTPKHRQLAVLAETAQRHPDRVAVIDQGGATSYRDLARSAGGLARALVAIGIGPGDRVGILAHRHAGTVAAIHAILAAGAAYTPVDPDWPVDRQATVLAGGEVGALVAAGQAPAPLVARLPCPLIQPGSGWAGLGRSVAPDASPPLTDAPPVDPSGRAPAYLLYTSGSTGVPKGVVVSHAAARAFVDWAVGEIGIRPTDVIAGHAPFSFDISTFDLFASAVTGATLALVPSHLSAFPVDLARFIAQHRVTVWYSVPFPLVQLARLGPGAATDLASLRAVLFAGEPFPPRALARLISLTPRAAHLNLYGPTETNVCTAWRVDAGWPGSAEPDRPVPIGRPVAGDSCLVSSGDTLVADQVGLVGELWVAGATLADGYWRDPAGTADRFVPAPVPGGRAYRTGDLVRIVAPGVFEFVGRVDTMVKVRGTRIELGEVETALCLTGGVGEACAVALPDHRFGHRIFALVSPGNARVEEIATVCRSRLPAPAVPDQVWAVGALPHTATGKIDRSAVRRIVQQRLDGVELCGA